MIIVKNNNMKTTLLIILSFLGSLMVRGQCNQDLVDLAVSQSGSDAIFVRDFKVKLNAGDASKPSPVGHFSIILKEGSKYRFNIANAAEFDGKAILQVYDKDHLIGSTYNIETKEDNQKFDFDCTKSATYQVLISFREAKEGCAVGIVSLIEKNPNKETPESADTTYEVLYTDFANPLSVEVKLDPDEKLELTIDSGRIEKSENEYLAYVKNTEWATIKLIITDNSGAVKLSSSRVFKVEPLPLPELILAKKHSNMISINDILSNPEVELSLPVSDTMQPYQLIEFTISTSQSVLEETNCYNRSLNASLLKKISSLNSGDRLFFKNIRVKNPKGKVVILRDVTYYIEK